MRTISTAVDADHAYLLPIGDLHVGARGFGKHGKRKLLGYLQWAREHEDVARIFLMGDLFDIATRKSKTSPFDSSASEHVEVLDIFEPFRDLVIGAVDGNHEARMLDFAGFSPTYYLCRALDIPYCRWSACLKFRVGLRKAEKLKKPCYRCTYDIFIHHSTGAGSTAGAALNRIEKLERLCSPCDLYLGGHHHQLVVGSRETMTPAGTLRRITYVCTGSFMGWEGSYAEEKAYGPAKLGAPRIRLAGADRKDIHVSV